MAPATLRTASSPGWPKPGGLRSSSCVRAPRASSPMSNRASAPSAAWPSFAASYKKCWPRRRAPPISLRQRSNPGTTMLGQRIGNYLIKQEIGQGGMGIVYEAWHEEIGRRAAIKVLRPAYAQDAELGARFLNEARAVNV